MKRHFLMACLLSYCIASAVLAQTAAPKLVIASTEQNAGEVKRGAEAKFVFVIKNEGNADLDIRNVAPSCGCTATDFTRTILPGQEGKINLAVNTTGYNGAVVKTAEVYTNDAQRARFTLLLSMVVSGEEAPKGTAIGSLFLNPADRWHTTIPLNLPTTSVITLFNNAAQPLQIKQHSVNNEAFKVAVTPLEAGKRFQLSITVKEGLPVGLHKAVLTVETDNAETPKLEIPLSVQVVAPVTVNPAKLVMDNVYTSQPDYDVTTYGKFAWVRFARGEGLELKSLTSDLPYLAIKIESVEGNKQAYLLRVTFKERPP